MSDLIKKLNQSKQFRWALMVVVPFALVVLVLGTIIALRWISSHHLVQETQPAPAAVASAPPSPSVPSAEQVAAAPHPPVDTSDNPPATETGRTVVEEEPNTPLPETEPPPPASAPREVVTMEQLLQREQVASAPAPQEPVASPAQESASMPAPAPAAEAPAPEPELQPPSPGSKPAWERLAVAAPLASSRPMIAVIIDDMGLDHRRSAEVLALPGPLTISFMSYAEDMAHQEAEAKSHGHEVMMHVPMEPLDSRQNPGPGVLTDKLSQAEVRKTLDADLAKFNGIVGINNHMGSKFTANALGMEVVMQDLRERGLLFIDSLTTDKSVGLAMARRYGVPTAARNVFLDDAGDLVSVDFELGKLEEVARKKGNAIAIGHPRDATIKALSEWLPKLKSKGFVLVPVTAIVKARMEQNPKTANAH